MADSRWLGADVARGHAYDDRWRAWAAEGRDPHGEVAFIVRYEPQRVLDAGCGTGRVAIELGARDIYCVGFDLDPVMLDAARDKAPELNWELGDAATIDLVASGRFDVVVLAGNVMIFLAPGTEETVVANMAHHLRGGGRLITGFQLRANGYGLDDLDRHATAAGLVLEDRFATWGADPFVDGGDYAVTVFRLTD